MKKMLLATALALPSTGCTQQAVAIQKQIMAAVAQRKPSPIIFFVSGIGQKKTVDAAKKFVAAQKMLLKQKPSKQFRK